MKKSPREFFIYCTVKVAVTRFLTLFPTFCNFRHFVILHCLVFICRRKALGNFSPPFLFSVKIIFRGFFIYCTLFFFLFRLFVIFDLLLFYLLYLSTFCFSTFCNVWHFVHSTFCNLTFCYLTFCNLTFWLSTFCSTIISLHLSPWGRIPQTLPIPPPLPH